MISEDKFPVIEGTSVTLHCEEGYRLLGDDVITCQHGTQYYFRQEPRCHSESKIHTNLSITKTRNFDYHSVCTPD